MIVSETFKIRQNKKNYLTWWAFLDGSTIYGFEVILAWKRGGIMHQE